MAPVTYRFNPNREPPVAFAGPWSYRRILDRTLFTPGTYASDLCVVNWVMLDYTGGDLSPPGSTPASVWKPKRASRRARSSTGCRPRHRVATGAPDGRACGCAAMSPGPLTAWPRRHTSASRAGCRR